MNENGYFLDRHNRYLRYLLLLSLFTFVILFVATTAHGAWYDSNWQYRKQITIDGSRVFGGPHANFPILIQLASDTDLAAAAQNDGDDILFTSSDEVTKIPHEIESFNSSTGALVAWVKVSLNANPTDTIIYMYYGYGSATNQQDATNVWDSNYLGVYHLKEDPSGTAPQMKDSTSNGNHGTSVGSMTSGDQVTGIIGGSLDFDGSNDEIRFSNAIIGDSSAWTITAWMKVTDTSGDKRTIYSEGYTTAERMLWLRVPQGGSTVGFWYCNPAGNWISNIEGSRNVFDSEFHYVAMVQSSKTSRTLYVDTVSDGSSSVNPGTLNHNTASIGMLRASYDADWFKGIIDEFRISNVARSAGWNATEYNNQVWPNTDATPSPLPDPNPGGGFITVHSETTEGGVNACGTNLVMVTVDGTTNGGFDDSSKRALFESWGWTVTAIADEASQATFDNAAANNDVMFISESADSTVALTKARDLAIGIVVEESWLWDEMNFATSGDSSTSTTTISISNSSHYITSPFTNGSLVIYTSSNLVGVSPVSLASGGQVLATAAGNPTLFVFDTGAALTAGTAADRRVGFPTSESYPSAWNADLKTLLQRSLDWAAGCGAGGNPCGTNLVMVTGDGTTTTDADDTVKKTLFESWGWTVTSIEDQYGDYSGAASSNDVMFISESAESSVVGTQATNLNIGILVEERALMDEMELYSSQNYTSGTGTQIDIVDNGHYIASTLSTGPLTIYSTTDNLITDLATPAPGAVVVAEEVGGNNTALIAIDTGETLDNGTGAVNRRVGFIAMHESTPSNWTTSMETLVARSLEWAAGCGAGGGTNLVPAALDDSFSTDEDVDLVDNVLGNDTLGDPQNTVTEISGVSHGVLTLNEDGSFTYDPDVGFSGTDTFTYRLTDADSETSDATVTITVNAVGGTPPVNIEQYSCNMKITIKSSEVAGDLNDFPVLIDVTDDSLKTSGCGFMTDPDGDDLIFTNSSKTIQLDHEIEKYDTTNGEIVAWVEVPFLSGSSNTEIFMYYGNSNVTSPTENPADVWDSNYKGVWHLKEDAATGTQTTIEERISFGEDDSEESVGSGSIDWGSSDLELGAEGGGTGYQEVGMRWRNVAIPQGATITSAYIEFTVDETDDEVTNLTFWGEDADNAVVFQNLAYDISSRIKTSASVAWNTVPLWDTVGVTHQSPDISPIIQEIVNRPGWTSGNSLVVIVTGSGERTAESYDGASGSAPLLHVEYGATADFHFDSTSNDNDGIPNGNTLTASGKIDGAQDFDGTNDWIRVPHSSSLNMTGDYSIELWVNYDTWETWDYLIGKGDDNNSDVPVAIQFWDQTNKYGTDYTDNSSNWCGGMANSSLYSGNWYHITVTYDASANRLNFYRNGQADGSDYGCDAGSNSIDWGIGADGLGHRELDGRIDEVRISNTIRSAAWIETSYNNQNSPSSFYSVEKNCPSVSPPIAEFSCSIPITIDSSKVSGTSDLINFPVLISLTDIGLKTTSNCGHVQNSNGYDIIFSDAAQTTILDHEIEKYNGVSGELVAWVRVPTLSATTDTTIYLHFGHSSVCGATENPKGVWDSNYVGVWHLDDMNNIEDSTSYNNDGTPLNVDDDTGKIGVGQDFDGNDSISAADNASLNVTSELTIEAWVKLANAGNDQKIVGKTNSVPADSGYILGVINGALYPEIWNSSGTHYSFESGTISSNEWTHLALTWTTGGNMIGYVNGSQVNSILAGSTAIGTSTNPLYIGVAPYNGSQYYVNGDIDEARISDTARSPDWIQTSYNNQSDPSSFYSVGASDCLFLSGFSCSRKITIDSSKVESTSDLSDFPVLIKIDKDCNIKTAANGGSIRNSSGWDIVFADSDGITQLAHEIEEYDGDSGDLTAWVKIPTLPYNSDKDIYMYYGKSGLICDPSNPAGVWSNSYRGVWHLNDTSGDTQDSTSYNTDGTFSGTVARGATGEIDKAFDVGYQGEVNWGDPGDGHLDGGTGSWTVSLWTNIDSNRGSGSWEKIINKGKNSWQAGYEMELDDTANNLYFAINDGSYSEWGRSAVLSFSLDTWMYLVGVVDRSSGLIRLYKDGNQVDTTSIYTIGSINTTDSLTLGKDTWGYPYASYEEIRVSNTARSAGWIKTEYNNQNDPSSFYSMSQDTCGGSYGFNYQYCKKITVDHTQVVQASNQNFPLLINLQNYDDLKTVENGGRVGNNNGWDIVFKTSNCLTLDHEIDYYDGTTGTLVAWVRIPDLTNAEDYEIYMYYGDSNVICSPENPDDLWDPSIYEAVYHLSDDYKDSTSNDRDGTNYGTSFTASQIGRGALFTPSNGWDHIDLGSWNVNDNDLVIQAWAWPNDFNQGDPRIVSKCADWGSSSQQHVFMLSLYNGTNGENRMRFRVKTGSDNASGTVELFGSDTTGSLPSAQDWYLLTSSYFDSTDQMKLWRDSTGDTTIYQNGWLRQNSWPVWIGANPYGTSNAEYSWDGILDEVRIISEPRSAGWITTEYRNQSDPGNFYTVGSCFEQTTEVTQEWVEEVQ